LTSRWRCPAIRSRDFHCELNVGVIGHQTLGCRLARVHPCLTP
jgi:hypothetical protein